MIMFKDKSNQSYLLLSNIRKGKIGEKIAELDYKNNGYRIIKTGIGSDFIAIKKFVGCDKHHIEYVEVKTGKSKQTKKQRRSMYKAKKDGKSYTIYRITDAFLIRCLKTIPDLRRSWHEM